MVRNLENEAVGEKESKFSIHSSDFNFGPGGFVELGFARTDHQSARSRCDSATNDIYIVIMSLISKGCCILSK